MNTGSFESDGSYDPYAHEAAGGGERKKRKNEPRSSERKTSKEKKTAPHLQMYTSDSLTKMLNEKLRNVIKTVEQIAHFKMFEVSVKDTNAAWVDEYLQKIPNPICINDIVAKCRNQGYNGSDEFKNDFRTITEQSSSFNGRVHVLTQAAEQIEARISHTLSRMDQLAGIEKELRKRDARAAGQAAGFNL